MKYTMVEGLLVKQMMKDLATVKQNHPEALGFWVDHATEDLKNILEFITEMLKTQAHDDQFGNAAGEK